MDEKPEARTVGNNKTSEAAIPAPSCSWKAENPGDKRWLDGECQKAKGEENSRKEGTLKGLKYGKDAKVPTKYSKIVAYIFPESFIPW